MTRGPNLQPQCLLKYLDAIRGNVQLPLLNSPDVIPGGRIVDLLAQINVELHIPIKTPWHKVVVKIQRGAVRGLHRVLPVLVLVTHPGIPARPMVPLRSSNHFVISFLII